MNRPRRSAAVLLAAAFAACGAVRAADATATRTVPAVPSSVDLRLSTAEADALRALWSDRLEASRRRWDADGTGRPFPAFALVHVFRDAGVVVSQLFSLYDCELPGNGTGAALAARCPMRVALEPPDARRIATFEGTCSLHVEPPDAPGRGPDPSANRTTFALEGHAVRVRVVEHGRPRRDCDRLYRLP